MQTSRRDYGKEADFSLEDARFITSRDIWLALDDSHCDGQIHRQQGPPATEPVRGEDLETYHRQLFYWLLIRCGPCFFSSKAELNQGLPVGCRTEN
jgi:hypothetical protein